MKTTDQLLSELSTLRTKYNKCVTRYVYILGAKIRGIEAELMKRLLLLILLIAGLTSCSKQADNAPTPNKPQTVTYTVTCKACLVYYEDNVWNRSNHIEGRPDAVSQHVNVYGSWNTTFTNDSLSVASLHIFTSVFTGNDQDVHANIHTNDGKVFDRVMIMGVDNNDVIMDLPL